MSDDFKDNALICVGILMITIPLARDNYKKGVYSKTSKKLYALAYCLLSIIIIWLQCDKGQRDNKEKKDLNINISSLHKENGNISKSLDSCILTTKIFLDTLSKKFEIIRDSNNKPIYIGQTNYSVNATNANNFHLGPTNNYK